MVTVTVTVLRAEEGLRLRWRSPFLFMSLVMVTPRGWATLAKGCQLWGSCQSGKGRYIAHRKELQKISEKYKKTLPLVAKEPA